MFLHFQFLLASPRTTLINNNIDNQEARAPSIRFCQPIEIITQAKLRGFVLKAAISGPHLNFYERNAITRAGFTVRQSARAPRSDSKTFFGLNLYLAGRYCENSKVPAASRNVNPARE